MGRFSRSAVLDQSTNLLKRMDRQRDTIESLEFQLAESCHDVERLELVVAAHDEIGYRLAYRQKEIERLELELVDQAAETFAAEQTNRALRDRIAELERVPTVATSVTWSRERDHGGEA